MTTSTASEGRPSPKPSRAAQSLLACLRVGNHSVSDYRRSCCRDNRGTARPLPASLRFLAAFCQLMMKRFKLRPVTRLIIAKLEEATRRIESGQRARLIVSVPLALVKLSSSADCSPRGSWVATLTYRRCRPRSTPRTRAPSATMCSGTSGTRITRRSSSCLTVGLVEVKTEFKLFSDGELGGEYGSYGRGGGYTGRGAHLLIVDDLMKETEVDSEAVLSEAHKAVQALSSRLDPEDVTCWIIVNTRYRRTMLSGMSW